MGVYGIYSLVKKNVLSKVDPIKLPNGSSVLVDADSFAFDVINRLKVSGETGLRMLSFQVAVETTLELLKRQDITFVFVFDSRGITGEKDDEQLKRTQNNVACLKQQYDIVCGKPIIGGGLAESPQSLLMDVLKKQKFHHLIVARGEADKVLAKRFRDAHGCYCCGILSSDTDFLFFEECSLMDINTLSITEKGVFCKYVTKRRFFESIQLDEDKAYLLSVLCGNDYSKSRLSNCEIAKKLGLKYNKDECMGCMISYDVIEFLKNECHMEKINQVSKLYQKFREVVKLTRDSINLISCEPTPTSGSMGQLLSDLTLRGDINKSFRAFEALGRLMYPVLVDNFEITPEISCAFDMFTIFHRALLSIMNMESGEFHVVFKDRIERFTLERLTATDLNVGLQTLVSDSDSQRRLEMWYNVLFTSRFSSKVQNEELKELEGDIEFSHFIHNDLPKAVQNAMIILFSWLLQCDGYCHYLTENEIEAFIATALMSNFAMGGDETAKLLEPSFLHSGSCGSSQHGKAFLQMENNSMADKKLETLLKFSCYSPEYVPKRGACEVSPRGFVLSRFMEEFIINTTDLGQLLLIPHLLSPRGHMFDPKVFNEILNHSQKDTVETYFDSKKGVELFRFARDIFFKHVSTATIHGYAPNSRMAVTAMGGPIGCSADELEKLGSQFSYSESLKDNEIDGDAETNGDSEKKKTKNQKYGGSRRTRRRKRREARTTTTAEE